ASGAGAGVAADDETITRGVTADVGDGATVSVPGNVIIEALAPETLLDVAAGLTVGGDAAIVGSLAVLALGSTVEAYIDDDADVSAGNDVLVYANRATTATPTAGGLSVGGEGALGGSSATTVTN